jgi:ABC-type lipoprotein export system ATPase subunit
MIKLERITKEYRSGRGHVKALNDVSLNIDGGTIAAVTGKSGSGKTTLLNCMGGLERPGKGSVTCFGFDLSALSGKALCLFQRRHVGFVFQHGNLLSYLTVFENIAFPLALNGVEDKKKAKRIDALLQRIGLNKAGAALPHELSGGEIQRVSIARAMAHWPKLLLADEPTASLDSDTGRNLIRFMFEMGREQECTIVFSTHDHEIIEQADNRIYIRDGRIVKEMP